MSTSTEVVYQVVGMSCGHCRSSVLEEVQKNDGADVSRDQIRCAVELAGYELDEEAA